MKRLFYILLFLLSFLPQLTAQSIDFQFSQLKKLEGKWLTSEGMKVGETWSYYSDELLIGKGWALNAKGDTIFTEDLRIIKFDQSVVYVAKPKGKNAVAFTLTMVTLNNEWIFENKAHDSPQRIVYQLHGFDVMDAWIGDFTKKDRFKEKARFKYTRIE